MNISIAAKDLDDLRVFSDNHLAADLRASFDPDRPYCGSFNIHGTKAERMAVLDAWITAEGYDPAALRSAAYEEERLSRYMDALEKAG